MTITKKTFSAVAAFIAVLAVAILMVCAAPDASAATESGKTAKQITAEIGTGWNLGNSLDATGGGNSVNSETSWGNPKTTKAMIDAVKAQGFNTVRIPVSWGNHTSGNNFTIDSAWLKRVKEVVDYCIDNDMFVILNIHHDTSTQYYYPSSTYKTQSVKFVKSIWSQVAAYFKDYDQRLVFETLNEPRLVGSEYEWYFPVDYPNSAVLDSINVINTLNQTAVDTIRAAGGKNNDRCIMVPGYGASINGCTTYAFKLPTDKTADRLIVSVHAYTPYNFALNANGTPIFSDDLKSEVDYLYNTIKSKFLDKGIPAIIGETSASNKNGNSAERVKWAQYYMGKSAEYGVPCMLWDNNVYNGSDKGECHGHLNRSTLGWYDKSFIDAVIKYGKKGRTPATPVTPSAPSKVTGFAKKSASATTITLKWNKNANASGYVLQQYKSGNWVTLSTITSNATTTYTVKGLSAGTTGCKFRIRAYKTANNTKLYSAWSSTLSVSTPPSNVNGLKVTAKTNASVSLQWNKNTSASGYVLEKYNGTKWVTVKNIVGNATVKYTVTGLKSSTTNKFRIKSYKGSLSSGYTYLNVNTKPYTTTGLKCRSKTNSSITLQWNKNTSAGGYVLEKYDGKKWVALKTFTGSTNTSYTVSKLKSSTTYKFRLRAYKTFGSVKEYSAYTYLNVNTKPYTTTGLKCKSKTNSSITLQWNKNTSAGGYVLEKYDGKKWVALKTFTSSTNTSYTVSKLKSSTTYKFRLRAYKTFGSAKEYSAYTYLNVNTKPYTTTGFKTKSVTKNTLTLQWNKNSSATGYTIEKWDRKKWVQIKKLTSNSTASLTVKGLKSRTTYKFRLKAYKIMGSTNEYSQYTSALTVKTK